MRACAGRSSLVAAASCCRLADSAFRPPQGFQYHSAEWLAALRARPDCGVVPLDDSHWLMAGPAADVYEAAVMEWLARTLGGGASAPPPPHGAAATTAAAASAAAAVAGESKKEL